MGTEKRERQKANRQQRLEEMARQSRRDKTRQRAIRITIAVVGGLVLLFGIAYLVRDDEADVETGLPPVTTVDIATTVATTEAEPTTTVDPDATTTTAGPTTTVAREFVFGTGECPEEDGSSTMPESFADAPQLCIDPAAAYSAEVVTNKGSFTIALDAATAPGNVNNFVTLARWGYYDGTGCHRVIADFVVQCGRPGEDEEAPGYTVPDELPSDEAYEEGVIAMANSGAPDSAGGQWFIITGPDGATLPPQYTVIGSVSQGLDSTVAALEGLADPLAENGVPPLVPIEIETVTITQS